MIIRKGHLIDLAELQQLFVGTIRHTCAKDYNSEQIDAWTAGIENAQRWQEIMTEQFVLIAQDTKNITGFCTLAKNCIDLLYVHKDHQRQGIAHSLYTVIEKEAKQQGYFKLSANVSKTARPFFEKVGFKVLNEQTVKLKGIELTNYKMIKMMG